MVHFTGNCVLTCVGWLFCCEKTPRLSSQDPEQITFLLDNKIATEFVAILISNTKLFAVTVSCGLSWGFWQVYEETEEGNRRSTPEKVDGFTPGNHGLQKKPRQEA